MYVDKLKLQIQQTQLLLMCAAEKWEKGAVYKGEKVGGRWKPKAKNSSTSQPKKKSMQEEIEYAQSDEQIAEVLSKRIVYFLDKGGDINQVKKFLDSRGIKMVEKVDNPDTGFSSFLFRQGNNSMYVFVGTDDDKDWESNRGKEVGRSQFDVDKGRIKASLSREKEAGNLVKVYGHSLGGALAQITASEFHELIDEVYTFNSAGVLASTASRFANANSSVKVTHFVRQSDVVSSFGQAFLPGDLRFYGAASQEHQDAHGALLTSANASKELPPPKWLIKKASVQ